MAPAFGFRRAQQCCDGVTVKRCPADETRFRDRSPDVPLEAIQPAAWVSGKDGRDDAPIAGGWISRLKDLGDRLMLDAWRRRWVAAFLGDDEVRVISVTKVSRGAQFGGLCGCPGGRWKYSNSPMPPRGGQMGA